MKIAKPEPFTDKPSIAVQDAFAHAFDLVKGLGDLFSTIACSDEGITPDGGAALEIIGYKLREHMTVVDGFFHPKEEAEG